MSEKLTVGFWAGVDYSADPRFTAAAATVPGTGGYMEITIGGPRSRERVQAEIEACERTLANLRAELDALPETVSESPK